MKRKTSNVPTRIWRFGARPPTAGAGIVRDALWRSGRYYNMLVEIERARSTRFAAVRREYAPDLAALEDEYEQLDDRAEELARAVKRFRQEHWRRTKGDKTLALPANAEAELAHVQAEKKRVSAEAKPLRKAFSDRLTPDRERYKATTKERAAGGGPRTKERVNSEVLAEMLEDERTDPAWRTIARSDADALARAKSARAASGLPPGTYLQVDEAFARAKKDASPRAPRFRAARGEGKIAVQLRGATTFADLLAGTTMFRIVPSRRPGARGKQDRYFTARIRVGSDGRAPVWADFPVKLHRRPPGDAAVKWAWIVVRKHGERLRYELQLVMEHPTFADPKRPAGVGDGGHVRIGWGQTDRGVRVATWGGGEVLVPQAILRRSEHADSLRSHADTHYDHVRRVLRLVTRTTGWERLRSERRRLDLRRICVAYAEHVFGARLRPMWRAWVDSRPRDLFVSLNEARQWLRTADDGAAGHLAWWLYTWARKDQHLRQWSADVRACVERQRDAIFREAAIRLATQYETLTVDSYSIAALKQRPSPLTMPGEAPNEVAQHNAQVAAPGRFREILLEVMGQRVTPCERSGGSDSPGGSRGRRDRKRIAPPASLVAGFPCLAEG